MNVDKSIQRLSWRLKNGKFTPNEKDAESLNSIIEWVNKQRKITINENVLFAKLFIYQYNQTINYYESSVFSKIPQLDLSRKLDADLESYYIAFTKSLNMNNITEIFRENGIESKHPEIMSKEERANQKLKINNMSEEDVLKISKDKWELEDVRNELNKMITEALNRFQ